MLNILPTKLRKKSRKYPIKRDEYSRSARRRAFEAFDYGKRPAEVALMVGISLRTACRYFADWKRQPKNLQIRYHVARAILKNGWTFSEDIVKTIATGLGMSQKEVILRLQRPWGLKQLLMGKWPNYLDEEKQRQFGHRLEAALKLAGLVEYSGMAPKEIKTVLDKLIDEARKIRAEQPE